MNFIKNKFLFVIGLILISSVFTCGIAMYRVSITINSDGSIDGASQNYSNGADLYAGMYNMNALYAAVGNANQINHGATRVHVLIPAGSEVFVDVRPTNQDGQPICSEAAMDQEQLIQELSMHVSEEESSSIVQTLFEKYNAENLRNFEAIICTKLLEYLETGEDTNRIDLVTKLIKGRNIQMLWLLADSLNNGTRGAEENKLLALRYMDIAAQQNAYAAPFYIKHYLDEWNELAIAENDQEAIEILAKYADFNSEEEIQDELCQYSGDNDGKIINESEEIKSQENQFDYYQNQLIAVES